VLPVDTLGKTIPWLPLGDEGAPGTYYFWFNVLNPPFNSELVRQAFAAAIDREALTDIARQYGKKDATPATTFTPPTILGRDLYNEVGIAYDPERARQLLAEAGYDDPSKFPTFTFLTNVSGDPAPAAHQKIGEAAVKMLHETLGVTGELQVISWSAFLQRIESDPPEMFRLGWAADVNDPDNFLREVFISAGPYNHGNFLSTEFDSLVERARKSSDPAVRQALYIEAERILCEIEVGVIPIYHAFYR
jgi:ABC-type transport system substrate-binding protein